MSEWSPTEAETRRIFVTQVLPVVFPLTTEGDEPPTLVLLSGQPGAGTARATSQILAEHPADMTALRGDDLRAFHPHYLELARSRSIEASKILAESTAAWVQQCLVHARTSSRSILLEGTFTPRLALGTAELFAREGFATRVVVAATPRSESLHSAASRYLLDAQAGRPSRFTSVDLHDAGWAGTRDLVTELSREPSVDRLTVLRRDGSAAFDGTRASEAGFAASLPLFQSEQASRMGGQQAMRWLSELRAMTDFTLVGRPPARPLADLLIELHRIALSEVVPNLPLPADSQARPTLEAAVARQMLALRRMVPDSPRPPDATGPVVTPSESDRGISR